MADIRCLELLPHVSYVVIDNRPVQEIRPKLNQIIPGFETYTLMFHRGNNNYLVDFEIGNYEQGEDFIKHCKTIQEFYKKNQEVFFDITVSFSRCGIEFTVKVFNNWMKKLNYYERKNDNLYNQTNETVKIPKAALTPRQRELYDLITKNKCTRTWSSFFDH